VPKALFSHSDQIEQWQTAVPQGISQLSGWAGRAADILHAAFNTGTTSMSISLGGNNVFQVGNQTQQFVSPLGGPVLQGNTGGPRAIRSNSKTRRCATRSTSTEPAHRQLRAADQGGAMTRSCCSSPTSIRSRPIRPAVNSLFPGGDLSNSLRAAVKTIKVRAELGLTRQTLLINHTGWDHHGELFTQSNMLATLDAAVGACQQALEMLGLAGEVVTFTASDFGRTLRSNGRGSTTPGRTRWCSAGRWMALLRQISRPRTGRPDDGAWRAPAAQPAGGPAAREPLVRCPRAA
jgi:uncharacterized protein (DUF1501 family)